MVHIGLTLPLFFFTFAPTGSTYFAQVEVVSYNRSCETVEQLCYIPGSHQLAVIQVNIEWPASVFNVLDGYTLGGSCFLVTLDVLYHQQTWRQKACVIMSGS